MNENSKYGLSVPARLRSRFMVDYLLPLSLGLLIGYVAWMPAFNPTLALLIPFGWLGFAKTSQSSLVAAGYFLSATRSVAYAAFGYFQHSDSAVPIGIGMWLGIAIIASLPWIIGAWLKAKFQKRHALIGFGIFCAVLMISMVPPFGIVGVSNPLLGLGWVAPGSGWTGIACYGGALLFFCLLPRKFLMLIPVAFVCIINMPHEEQKHSEFAGIYAVNTKWGLPSTTDDVVDRFFNIKRAVLQYSKLGAKAIVFPEGILADWKERYDLTWKYEVESLAKKNGIEVVVGMDEVVAPGVFENAVRMSGREEGALVRAKQTIPNKTQFPWSAGGYPMHWERSAQTNLAGKKANFLFCYEEHLFGLLAYSVYSDRPDVFISVINSWWALDDYTRLVQLRHIESFGTLFGIPVIRSENT